MAHAAVKLLINTCNFGKKEIIDEIFKVYVVFLKFFDSLEIFFLFCWAKKQNKTTAIKFKKHFLTNNF